MLAITWLKGGIASAIFATIVLASAASAAEHKPFTDAAFDAAQKSGKPMLVEVTAPWCPTCKAQKPILSKLEGQTKFNELIVLEVDFDSQKDALRKLNVRSQSTLITYKGGKETSRTVGETAPDAIAKQLDSAI